MRRTLARASLLVLMALVGCLLPGGASAQEAPRIERRIPPAGIELPADQRTAIETELQQFATRYNDVKTQITDPRLLSSFPDVEIYHKAVEYALRHGEFFAKSDAKTALALIEQGQQRLAQLAGGNAPWNQQRGLVVRGYRSRIDGSVQPYGLEIPEGIDLEQPVPLYVWLHGRGETTTDLRFIQQRQTTAGRLRPETAIVLHPFGRYCNAFKFAGEADVLESIAAVQSHYKIDPARIVLAGFSMGGAGAWHLGAQYADRWAAVHAGAGFVDVAKYQGLNPDDFPWYERQLWRLYDVDGYVRNLFNVPVLAYSGEMDKQKHAADLMAESYAAHGQQLEHIIGPGMGHQYDDGSLAKVHEFLARSAAEGNNPYPRSITLQTPTLRYNKLHWVEILGLAEHWLDSRVDAEVVSDVEPLAVAMTTRNVTALRITQPWAPPASLNQGFTITIDEQPIDIDPAARSRGAVYLARDGKTWRQVPRWPMESGLWKISGLQGPIDDVLLTPFIVVAPSGKSDNAAVQRWVEAELAHFIRRWSEVFRGDVQLRTDIELTAQEAANNNLVLWGDPQSNSVIARLLPQLPVRWTSEAIEWQQQRADAGSHVLAMIYPNPETADRYIVLNSGPTFREAHDRTNSLQIPHLPDWAVLDISQPPTAEQAGRVVDAGFFDERWQFKPRRND